MAALDERNSATGIAVLPRDRTWAMRRDQIIVILGGLAITAVILWVASHVTRALLLLVIGSLLAYALAPAIRFFSRFMPRPLALALVYLILLSAFGGLFYLVITTAVAQFNALAPQINTLLKAGPNGQPAPLIQTAQRLGITSAQIDTFKQQVTTRIEGTAQQVVPFVQGLFNSVLDTFLVVVLSIYLLIDGQRLSTWLTTRTPSVTRGRITSFLTTLQNVVGGYIRGQLIMSTLIGVLVGAGMFVLRVPDAVLLGVLAFILAFIPILGTLASGVICVLIALTQGVPLAIGVLVYFVVVHIIEGDVVGPRVVGQAVGLHPAVSIVALIAGSELFGITGALFASPIAGLVQALLTDFYVEWRKGHPDQFAHNEMNPLAIGASAVVATATAPGHEEDLDASERVVTKEKR